MEPKSITLKWVQKQFSAANFPMRSTGKLVPKKGNGPGDSKQPVWRLALYEVKLKSVDFLGDDNYILRKQGDDSYENDKFEDNGDVAIDYPEWQDENLDGTPEINDPACYKIGAKPQMTAVLTIPEGVTETSAKLRVLSSQTPFCEKDIKLKAGDNTIPDLKWEYTYFGDISNAEYELKWQISLDGGATFCTIATTTTQMFSVLDKPHGSPVTAKRLDWCTRLASEKCTPAEIADVIGPDATGSSRFSGEHSIHYDMRTAWEVLDGTEADCGTLSTLMKFELEQLGCNGAKVMYVYARHAGWQGLAQESPAGNETDKNGNLLDMWFAVPPLFEDGGNRYEGCCVFQGKWWMGGIGRARSSARDVLFEVTYPNKDGRTNSHQAWSNNTMKSVDYPTPRPPNWE